MNDDILDSETFKSDYDALHGIQHEELCHEEYVAAYQILINSGTCWKLEGHVGRTAMSLIESGHCTLGEVGHRDYWGNYVPSKYEVKAGTKGSQEFVDNREDQ